MNSWTRLFVAPAILVPCVAVGTPQFARELGLPCVACHTQPPKLNLRGQKFADSNYRSDTTAIRRSFPVSVWSSGLAQSVASDPDDIRSVPNRVELISAGRAGNAAYFIEWRALSREFLSSGDVRDRSGRFEDAFLVFDTNADSALQIGQFRMLSQIDVSRRLQLGEPVAFSTGQPGNPDPDARIAALRSFSLSGRAPAIRYTTTMSADRTWTLSATLPFPGEFSIPLTREARRTASFEFEPDPKGIFAEVYRRNGLESFGIHGFVGRNRRSLVGAAFQVGTGPWFGEAGISHVTTGSFEEWRLSAGVDWIPSFDVAAGVRFDWRDSAGQKPMLLPYASFARPFGSQAIKLTFEARFQQGALPRFLAELGWMF